MSEKNEKLNIIEDELNEDELNQVSGGAGQAYSNLSSTNFFKKSIKNPIKMFYYSK